MKTLFMQGLHSTVKCVGLRCVHNEEIIAFAEGIWNAFQMTSSWQIGQNCLDIWRLADVSSCHRLASADWAAKTGKRRGGFLTTVRPGLEKQAWWVHTRYFWVFQARRWSRRDLWACAAKLSGRSRTCWPNAWDPDSHPMVTPQHLGTNSWLFA